MLFELFYCTIQSFVSYFRLVGNAVSLLVDTSLALTVQKHKEFEGKTKEMKEIERMKYKFSIEIHKHDTAV